MPSPPSISESQWYKRVKMHRSYRQSLTGWSVNKCISAATGIDAHRNQSVLDRVAMHTTIQASATTNYCDFTAQIMR